MNHLGDRVDHWYVCDLPIERAATAAALEERLRKRGILDTKDSSVTQSASPLAALNAARGRAGENDRIIVFGSFYTVADILAAGSESVRQD